MDETWLCDSVGRDKGYVLYAAGTWPPAPTIEDSDFSAAEALFSTPTTNEAHAKTRRASLQRKRLLT